MSGVKIQFENCSPWFSSFRLFSVGLNKKSPIEVLSRQFHRLTPKTFAHTRHELTPMSEIKSLKNFTVTDIRSLHYSSALQSPQRPGAQVYDVIYNYVTSRKNTALI